MTTKCTACQQEIDFTLPSTKDNCLECLLTTIDQSAGPIAMLRMAFGLTDHIYQKGDRETYQRCVEKTQQILLKLKQKAEEKGSPPQTPSNDV